jgi:Family of unknown function (DUF6159)
MMGRIGVGWRLVKSSASVMRADRSLLVFPVLAIFCAYGAMLVVSSLGAGVAGAAGVKWLIVPFLLVALYVAVYLVVYFSVALACASAEVIDGRNIRVIDGLRLARRRRREIALWALMLYGVGLVLTVVGTALNELLGGRVGNVFARAAGFGWSLASFFVIPLIAFEGLRPRAALKQSRSLVKRQWGEALAGRTGIGVVIALIALLPIGGLSVAAEAINRSSAVAGGIGYGIVALLMLAAFALASGLATVFRVELYRYATTGELPRRFAPEDVVATFGATAPAAGEVGLSTAR